jgi:hypothetical protein
MSRRTRCILTASFGVLIAGSLFVLTYQAAGQADSAKSKKSGVTCDVQLDPHNHQRIIIILDLTDLDATKQLSKAQVSVEFVDDHGKVIGTKQFAFINPGANESPLAAGKKYSRRFEYDERSLQAAVATVRPISSNALVITEIKAASGQ